MWKGSVVELRGGQDLLIYFITISVSRSRPSDKDSSHKHLKSVIIYSPSRHPNLHDYLYSAEHKRRHSFQSVVTNTSTHHLLCSSEETHTGLERHERVNDDRALILV